MNFSASAADERVLEVELSDDALSVSLRDGRIITVPLVWYPRLLNATPAQRRNWKIAGGGYGIHWPDLDEDLSTEGLLRGAPAPKSGSSTSHPRLDLLLTQRQQQVVSLLTQGLTQKEIATQLRLSPRTVQTNVQRVLLKLGSKAPSELKKLALPFRFRFSESALRSGRSSK
jgi:DNA-binding CsgD family transcriptional regulator